MSDPELSKNAPVRPGPTEQPADDLAVVIMAGGAGTRFWPVSTETRPKQFLRLHGPRSLIQQSYDRACAVCPAERILVLTNARFVPLCHEQLPELPEENVIGEPMRRDTAAAVALAALVARARWGDPTMAVLTADHLIEPVELFQRCLCSAAHAARASGQALYTFGVQPGFASTGYGYLQRGEPLLDDQGVRHFKLRCFREKPDAETARRYLASGEFYWNSGMFVWQTAAILKELEAQLPTHLEHLRPALGEHGELEDAERLRAAFEPLQPISIDFGVMEHAAEVRCVEARFSWSDVGGWLALETLLQRDPAGNAYPEGCQVRGHDASGNLVFSEDPSELVALVGVSGLIVVRAGRRTLVVPRERAEEIKKLVASLPLEER
jgi:mannose-1-phosphate guanylyltransferase